MPLPPSLQPSDMHPFVGLDVPGLLAHRAQARRDHPFLVWEPFETAPALPGGSPQTWTYGQFHHEIGRIAGGLAARGVRLGDRVLIHLDNCPEAVLAWYACTWLGAVAVTTNARAADDELRYYAEHCGAVAAITQPKFAERVAANCPGLRWQVVTATNNGAAPAQPVESSQRFETLYADHPAPRRAPDPLAACSVQYTSGTTSRPKAVLWTHANALWGARINAVHEDLQASDVHLIHLPLFHTNAQSYSLGATLWAGGTAVVLPRFSASRFWPISLKHRCSWASMIPFCLKALAAHEVPAHHYRLWGAGACALPSDAHFRVQTMGWWGMTETITHGIVSCRHWPSPSLSIGRPAPEYGIAIVDDDEVPKHQAVAIGPGGSGQLLVRGIPGLSLFAEYLGNAAATESSYTADGWFRTGDRVDLLEDGSIRFGDRSKDMLKVGGENVAASEIERVVALVPGVHECTVVARKHRMLDEVPVLFVIPTGTVPEAQLKADVGAACAQQLADFKRPHELRVVDSLPRSTLDKVAKAQLRQLLEAEGQIG